MGAVLLTAAVPILLMAPAIWNGYPILQWDTGGYLARWYEGYLVPSRSTSFGIYLHLGETTYFWINLLVQSLCAWWIIRLALRMFGLARPSTVFAMTAILSLTTALPWLSSMLLTDIFAGLSVLAIFILAVCFKKLSTAERIALFAFIAFSASTHNATLGVLFGLCATGWMLYPVMFRRLPWRGLLAASLTIPTGAALLVAANFALSGQIAWTPGGSGIAFGRMLQDGLVARYLNAHCGKMQFKLCPYRNDLPPTADDFLWGHSVFNSLGRFNGLGDEMAYIAEHALVEYPGAQAAAMLKATGEQLAMVATGEGSHDWIPHTIGIITRYIPNQVQSMREARQQHEDLGFDVMNRLHVPVAWASMVLLLVILGHAGLRRSMDDLTLLAGTITLALLGNALICGGISGPHDRYGARLVWVATFVVLIQLWRLGMKAFNARPSRPA